MRPNISLGDTLAGLHAAFGTALALMHRFRSKVRPVAIGTVHVIGMTYVIAITHVIGMVNVDSIPNVIGMVHVI